MPGETNRGITCSYNADVLALDMARFRKVMCDTLEEMGYNLQNCNIEKMLSGVQWRNMCIRQEYNECRAQGIKSDALICKLANTWYLSYDTVYHIVHAKDMPK